MLKALDFLYAESKNYFKYLKNRLKYRLLEGGIDSVIEKEVNRFYQKLSPDDPILTHRILSVTPETMKKIVKDFMERCKTLTVEDAVQLQYRISRGNIWHWETRPPDIVEAINDYLSFLGQYSLDNPESTAMEAHEACMKAHPEYWPETLLQKTG